MMNIWVQYLWTKFRTKTIFWPHILIYENRTYNFKNHPILKKPVYFWRNRRKQFWSHKITTKHLLGLGLGLGPEIYKDFFWRTLYSKPQNQQKPHLWSASEHGIYVKKKKLKILLSWKHKYLSWRIVEVEFNFLKWNVRKLYLKNNF